MLCRLLCHIQTLELFFDVLHRKQAVSLKSGIRCPLSSLLARHRVQSVRVLVAAYSPCYAVLIDIQYGVCSSVAV